MAVGWAAVDAVCVPVVLTVRGVPVDVCVVVAGTVVGWLWDAVVLDGGGGSEPAKPALVRSASS